jgi:hypothetical protein
MVGAEGGGLDGGGMGVGGGTAALHRHQLGHRSHARHQHQRAEPGAPRDQAGVDVARDAAM